jgi:tRNA(Ile)-lysidine synthase
MRLRRIEPLVRRALRGPCPVPPGGVVLVAVSGGADSTALLVALDRVRREFNLTLHGAHLHHGLRGAEADADLVAVERLCASLRVPLIAARWNTRLRMRRRSLSGHAGLRTLRREFLAAAARRTGASAIATAHTADDQLETLLMRLVRGSGLTGLGAMRERSRVQAGAASWIKPLLGAARADIESDLRAAGIAWREDRSNHDPHYLRSRIRDHVVPALVDAGRVPGAMLAAHAARATRELREARAALELVARRVARRATRGTHASLALNAAALAATPRAIRRLVLREAWARLGPPRSGLTHRHLEALLALVSRPVAGAIVGLPDGWRAERHAGQIRFAATRGAALPRAERVEFRDVNPARQSNRFGRRKREGGSLLGLSRTCQGRPAKSRPRPSGAP